MSTGFLLHFQKLFVAGLIVPLGCFSNPNPLVGGAQPDKLIGYGGEDVLVGWGRDWVEGNSGNDVLFGGDGTGTDIVRIREHLTAASVAISLSAASHYTD